MRETTYPQLQQPCARSCEPRTKIRVYVYACFFLPFGGGEGRLPLLVRPKPPDYQDGELLICSVGH